MKGELNPAYSHGHAMRGHSHPTYVIWTGIKYRTQNPKCKRYMDYGGRGIQLCEAWQDYWTFYTAVGDPPEGMSLDRIDNDGNYEPGNVRWASDKEQSRNRRNRRRWEWGGEDLMLSEWAEVLEMDFDALRQRLDSDGTLVSNRPEIYRTRLKGNKLEIYSALKKKYLGGLHPSADENDILEFLRTKNV